MFEKSGTGFKNRVLLVAFLLTSLVILIFAGLIYSAQKTNFDNTKKEFEHQLTHSIEQTVATTINTYSMMASVVLETTEAKALMKAGKRDELYALLESKWKLWSTINPDFRIMLFHRADGTAFLRMHKPEVYDDYLSGIRPMVKAVHEQQKVLTGYETGKYSTVFRLMTPIFYEGEYLGALDFGINPNYFVKTIHEFSGNMGVLFIKEKHLKLFKREATFQLNEYSLQSSINKETQSLLTSLPANYAFTKETMLEVGEKHYFVHAYPMYDFEGNEKAQLLFFLDLTESVNVQQQFSLILLVTSLIFLILMFFLLNRSFDTLLIRLKQMHDEHTQEIKEMDAIMHRQSKMAAMGEMLSMIAHQWRQPLGSIAAVTGGLKLQIELDRFKKELFEEKLDNINDYVQYMSQTVDDFRNLYKPDKQKEPIVLKDVADSALTIMEPTMKQHRIEVVTEYETDAPVMGYSNELIQVILNLLKNAQDMHVDNQTEAAKITVTVKESGEGMQSLVVADNGTGVPEAMMEKIFEPYYSTKDERNGTGLGLYMSRSIVEDHCGGKLRVENHGGAHFIITLPVGAFEKDKL